MAETIWGQANPTGVTGYSTTTENGAYGVYFTVAVASTLTAVWFYSPSGAASLPTWTGIYSTGSPPTTGTLLASNSSPSWSGAAGSGWVRDGSFPGAALSPGTNYVAAYYSASFKQGYLYTGSTPADWFPSTSPSGNITAPVTVGGSPYYNAPYNNSANAFPATNIGSANINWLADVEVQAAVPVIPAVPLAVPPGRMSPAAFWFLPPPPPPAAPAGVPAGAALLSGTGSLSVSRAVTFAAAASLSGTGTLSAAGGLPVYRLFPSASGPGTAVSNTGNFISGVVFAVSGGGAWFEGYWWWVCGSGQSTSPVKCALWSPTSLGTGSLVAGSVVTSGTLTAGQWNYIPLSTPVQLAPSLDPATSVNGSAYIAGVGCNGNFPDTNNYWGAGQTAPSGITNGPLTAYSGSSASLPAPYTIPQGCYTTGGSDPAVTMPQGASGTDNFWVDVQVSTAPPPGYSGSYRIWPNKADANGATVTDTTDNDVIATEVHLSQACTLNKVWYYSQSSAAALGNWAGVYQITGANSGTLMEQVASPSWSGAAGSGWVAASFSGSTVLPAGSYKICVGGPASLWGPKDASTGYFSAGAGSNGITSGPLSVPKLSAASTAYNYNGNAGGTPPYSDGTTLAGQPTFAIGAGPAYPYLFAPVATPSAGSSQNYWVDLEVTPSVVPAGAAALSGSGTLTAAGGVQFTCAAALSGTGTLAAARTLALTAAAALSGSGTLAASAAVAFTSAAALSGSGILTAPRSVQFTSAAVLSGSGTIAAAETGTFTVSCALSGSGTLTPAALVTQPAAAALSGTGTLGAAAAVQFASASALSGSGTLTAAALAVQPAGAALSGSGTLTAAGSVSGLAQGSAALSGTGTLAAVVTVQFAAGAALSGAGAVVSAALVTSPGGASLGGTGILLAAVSVTLPASAAMSGQGTLTAAAVVTGSAGAALSGTGTLAAGPVLVLAATAVLSGTGTLTAAVRVITPVTEPAVAWSASPAAPRWGCTPSAPRWRVTMAIFRPISALSLECVNVLWNSDLDGTVVDPTGQATGQPQLPVYFAFPLTSGDYSAPAEPSVWFTASWLLGGTGRGYVAQCLVGPGDGVVTLAAGQAYDVFSKVTGDPEAPARFVGVQAVY